jgi:hypothetical protein
MICGAHDTIMRLNAPSPLKSGPTNTLRINALRLAAIKRGNGHCFAPRPAFRSFTIHPGWP